MNANGFNDGLLYYDEKYATDGITKIFTTKRFYVLGQFSRYVRPGAVRHDVTGAPAGRAGHGVRGGRELDGRRLERGSRTCDVRCFVARFTLGSERGDHFEHR